jgi:Tol biopolymer transport system component
MKRRSIATVVLSIALLIAVAMPSSPILATSPGVNGRIVFRRFFNDAHTWGALFTIRPDGTGLLHVTHPQRGVVHESPDWSADGRWIVYNRIWEGHRGRIFKIHPDGTGRMNLSRTCTPAVNCVIDARPAWSPDGERIAFWRGFGHRPSQDPREADLMVMRADGTGVRKVTDHDRPIAFGDFGPQWSPNGERLVFNRLNKKRGLWAIMTIKLDGTGLRRLTPWRLDAGGGPDWSPDGRWIVFRSHTTTHVTRTNVCMVHPNGTALHRITSTEDGAISWLSSSFSPNGSRITVGRAPGVGEAADVWTMKLDGSDLRNVTQSVRWDSFPDWGPRRT